MTCQCLSPLAFPTTTQASRALFVASACSMSGPSLLPNLNHWFSPSVSLRLQQLCKRCIAEPTCHPLWRTQAAYSWHSRRSLHSSAAVHCIKPGTSPEEVIKRLKKDDVTVTFARSGGAGGQNVNKVNTKVDMRLNVDAAGWISEDLREALQRLEKGRINKEGELVVTSTKTRSQADNIEDAMDKMQGALDRAAESIIPHEVDPAKIKKIAKQKKVSNESRLHNKKAKSQKKSDRRGKLDWS